MMKAMLIVSALGGGMGTYEVEMPSMKRVHQFMQEDHFYSIIISND